MTTTFRTAAVGLAAAALGLTVGAVSHAQAPKPAATFTADGKLEFPKDYRTWVYLSSGLDMSYVEKMNMGEQPAFDNVFVDPAAYAAFQKTGHWPEGAMFVLEVRRGANKGSIN